MLWNKIYSPPHPRLFPFPLQDHRVVLAAENEKIKEDQRRRLEILGSKMHADKLAKKAATGSKVGKGGEGGARGGPGKGGGVGGVT